MGLGDKIDRGFGMEAGREVRRGRTMAAKGLAFSFRRLDRVFRIPPGSRG